MSNIRSMLRKHLHFIVIVSILLVLMTWPTIVYVFDTETFWLPTDGRDVWMNIWDAWHLDAVVAGKASPYFTDMFFHPIGLSLEYHPGNAMQRTLLWLFQSVMGTSNAFSLIYLLIVITTVWSAYFYLNFLLDDRWLALFGSVVFGFSQHVVGHANHPMVNQLATIPLSIYALQRGVNEQDLKWMLLSGFLVGITAFIGLYILVCLLLSIFLYFVCFSTSKWRQPRFWFGTALMLGVAGLLNLLHVYPMIRDSSRLDEALQKNSGLENNNDLLSYFVSGGHPLLTPVFDSIFDLNAHGDLDIRDHHKTSYLGYFPLLLIGFGLSYKKYRRRMFPWLLMLIPFLILRLGAVLQINGETFPNILLPKHFLNTVFPALFLSIYETDHYQIAILLPFAVLSCLGLMALLKSAGDNRRFFFVLVAVTLVTFEYYQTPQSQVVSEQQLAFMNWLKNEPDQEEIRLINLPMGRRSAKLYGFYQTLNSYPHVEGVANRLPAGTYDYIHRNILLASWNKYTNPRCELNSFDRYLSATEQLLDDGFSHVLHHHRERNSEAIDDSFRNIPSAYQNEYVSIYRLKALRENCLNRVEGYQNQLPILKEFLLSPINRPRSDVSLLALYPSAVYSSEAHRPYDIALSQWRELTHVVHDSRGAATIKLSDWENMDLENIVAENNLFWLIYSPQESDPSSPSQFATWLNQNLSLCQQVHRGEDLIVDYYIDHAYSCELVVTDDPLELRYDNGITLANLLAGFNGNQFSVDSWWQRGDIDGYAYTIQVFNEHGEKKLQVDRVIHSRPLSRAQFDTSNLEPGDYVAKLIVYETESGQSQQGIVMQNQHFFLRELEIAYFRIQA